LDSMSVLIRHGKYVAFEAAARSVELLQCQSTIDLAEFCMVLDQAVEVALQEAFADAQQAWSAGHSLVAEVTFNATMQLAGVRAAKQILGIAD